ncbi:hypothetical protein SPRG_06429 [Saprolegnia parasitica CBS 223.65]|uniref:W2 domain-containing protein n=1 Tax=Saprolegnia parasitica (strain CBS 223.65) TaxID=695850 RepID=A0A067CP31_SAPPC|nr:hypothetical protein SPRG_06429 [Saprolegnia parasitica CBS 223.65]KDO28572.1 hypothetical protein SPRG_06429 [Saprolegnia parasitica CBS 223.65]|eukprot:XP_012200636.1 hypothetical protein SPRG_06429 [Saprolegnia parasitica CBS 223.65]
MTAAALVSFAATERVHAHLPVVAALDDKHAQLMTLLAAHLPVPDCPAALHPLTLGDLVLSIEAAQLHTPLSIVLALLHIDDSYHLCHAMHTWHDAGATLHDAAARLQTLYVLVDATMRSLRTVDHEPAAIAALQTAIASSSCACLRAHVEPSCAVETSRGQLPHATPLQDVLDLVVRLATSYTSLCQAATPKQCPSIVPELPPLETIASVHDAIATSDTDELQGNEILDEWWPRATSTTAAQDAMQTFARLLALGSAQWSTSNVTWLQAYLDGLTDLDRLSIAVECIRRQPPYATPDVSASVAKAFNTLTTDHMEKSLVMLLRCLVWAPETVLHQLLHTGVTCPEHVPVFLRLFELAPSLAQSPQLLPSLGDLVLALTTETVASTAHLFAELTSVGIAPMLDVVGTCILPHLRGVNDLGWDLLSALSPWPCLSEAAMGVDLLDRTCAILSTAWTSTRDADAAARLLPIARALAAVVAHPTMRRLEAYVTAKDIRFVLLLLPLFPSTPLPLPTAPCESVDGVYTLSKDDVCNVIRGALLDCASAVAFLPSLAAALHQGRLAVAGVPACRPVSMLALLSTWILASLAAGDDSTRFVFEFLPQLLPPDSNTPLDATLCVARGMLLRALATKSSWDRTSLSHVLHCIEYCILQDPSSVSTHEGLLPLVLWLLREQNDDDDDVLLMVLRKMTRAWHEYLSPDALGELHTLALELLSKNIAPTKTVFRHVHGLLTTSRRDASMDSVDWKALGLTMEQAGALVAAFNKYDKMKTGAIAVDALDALSVDLGETFDEEEMRVAKQSLQDGDVIRLEAFLKWWAHDPKLT